MTQISRFWDGTATGDATNAPYDAATKTSSVLRSISGAGGIATNLSAVFRGELNQLAVTGVASPVTIDTGRAITYGTWFEQDASSTIAIPTPAASTRVDRIVLRKDWALQTVRITRIAGVEGGGTPAMVQIAGVQWDEPLAQASITTGGVITVTDQRQFVGMNPTTDVATGQVLTSGGIGAAPVWSASPSITSLTASSFVAAGANPAASGVFRMSYLGSLIARNSVNNADGTVIGTTGSADITIGGATFTNANFSSAGQVRIGTSTSNTKQTNGLTVQQGSASDEILSLKSSSVAHGMTTKTETDTYGAFSKQQGGGSLQISGFSGTSFTPGIYMGGYSNVDDTTKATSSDGYIDINAGKKSGTTVGNIGATANLLAMRNNDTTEFIFRGDGTPYQHAGTTWTNFDTYDDIAMLTAASAVVSRPGDAHAAAWYDLVKQHRHALESTGLVVINDGPDEDGSVFWSLSGFIQLSIGAIRQVGQQTAQLADSMSALEDRLALVGG